MKTMIELSDELSTIYDVDTELQEIDEYASDYYPYKEMFDELVELLSSAISTMESDPTYTPFTERIREIVSITEQLRIECGSVVYPKLSKLSGDMFNGHES